MFGPRSRKPEEAAAPAGPLDRIGRRTPADGRPGAAGPVDRSARIAAAAAALHDAVTPRLREMMKAGASAGEVSRQAGLLAQLHFRNSGALLAPLELRSYVAEVLRPVLPASTFSAPTAVADEAPAAADEAPVAASAEIAAEPPAPVPQVVIKPASQAVAKPAPAPPLK